MKKHTKYTQINTNESICTVKWAQCDKPNPKNCKNCSHKCAYDYTASIYNKAQNSTDNLPCYLRKSDSNYNVVRRDKESQIKMLGKLKP